jgi:hypothetical protein
MTFACRPEQRWWGVGRGRPGLGWLSLVLFLGGFACAQRAARSLQAWPAPPAQLFRSSGTEPGRDLSVIVYDANLSLIRDTRTVALARGRVGLEFANVSAHLVPSSVHLNAVQNVKALQVLEQNYRFNPLTPEALLTRSVGHQLLRARYDEANGEDQVSKVELLAAGPKPVVRASDGQGDAAVSTLGSTDRLIFGAIPPDLQAEPTMSWQLESEATEQRLELTYLTQNLEWHADYVLLLRADQSHADLSGWITLSNQSGIDLPNVQVTLALPASALGSGPRYDLQRRTDLRHREKKQVQVLDAHDLPLTLRHVVRAAPVHERQTSTARQPVTALALLETQNTEAIGRFLPAGTIRAYRADSQGAQEYVAQAPIETTARGERLEIPLGEVFDVVAERRQLEWQVLSTCSAEGEWTVDIRNHTALPTTIDVIENVTPGSELLRSNLPLAQKDAERWVFRLDVPANGDAQLSYRLRARWC